MDLERCYHPFWGVPGSSWMKGERGFLVVAIELGYFFRL